MLEEEVESSMVRKRLQLSNDDSSNDDSSDSSDSPDEEEEMEEEFSSGETSMKQLDTSEEKLFDKHARGMLFGDDDDTPSTSSEPHTPEIHH
jgi:hypothetical protein